MDLFEKEEYFIELLGYYERVKDKSSIYTINYKNIFKSNRFNKKSFDIYFNKLDNEQKYNFYNYLLSYDLISITPLDIRIKLGEYFKSNEEVVNKILLEKKTYLKYYPDRKTLRVIDHCPEYYKLYLGECEFSDNNFKNLILDKLKN